MNVIHTRSRMGVLRGWERFAIRRGGFLAGCVLIAIVTAALIHLFPIG